MQQPNLITRLAEHEIIEAVTTAMTWDSPYFASAHAHRLLDDSLIARLRQIPGEQICLLAADLKVSANIASIRAEVFHRADSAVDKELADRHRLAPIARCEQ